MATKKAPTKTAKVAKVSNGQKKTTTKVVTVKKSNKKTEVVRYLKEGITGKQMMQSIFDANNVSKAEVKSLSWCMKQAIKVGKPVFDNIKGFKKTDIKPAALLEHRSAHRVNKETFSVYEVLMMIKKMYQVK